MPKSVGDGADNSPPASTTSRRGRITFYWDDENVIPLDDAVVETMTIYTHMRHFSLQNVLGESDGGSATFRPDGKIGYSVLYDIQRRNAKFVCRSGLSL